MRKLNLVLFVRLQGMLPKSIDIQASHVCRFFCAYNDKMNICRTCRKRMSIVKRVLSLFNLCKLIHCCPESLDLEKVDLWFICVEYNVQYCQVGMMYSKIYSCGTWFVECFLSTTDLKIICLFFRNVVFVCTSLKTNYRKLFHL